MNDLEYEFELWWKKAGLAPDLKEATFKAWEAAFNFYTL